MVTLQIDRRKVRVSQNIKLQDDAAVCHDLERLTRVNAVKRPKILLVNPCVIDNFPISRLSLSLAFLTAVLRREELAEVTQMDMQYGCTVDDIVEAVKGLRFDGVGIGVSFGQLDLAINIANCVLSTSPSVKLIFGNIVASYAHELILQHFPAALIATEQGEQTIIGFAKWLKGDLEKKDIPGAIFIYEEKLISNPPVPFDIKNLPKPALDLLPQLAAKGGALTLEFSRGCQYGKCTFCPRDHKTKGWRGLSSDRMADDFIYVTEAAKQLGMKPHVFFADEEFIGEDQDEIAASRRINDFCHLISHTGVKWDAEARADQVRRYRETESWHIDRINMWRQCSSSGLNRLFLGIESGCSSQLIRYGKGTTVQQNVEAIRILSALGIRLRFGFITFDPLMPCIEELEENIRFLGRDDVILKPVLGESSIDVLERCTASLVQGWGCPIYEAVSYLGATMEVLPTSAYYKMIKLHERKTGKKLALDQLDYGMGRVVVSYINSDVRLMAEISQRWVDRNFAFAYAVKSMHKIAVRDDAKVLMNYMCRIRAVTFMVLCGLIRLGCGSSKVLLVEGTAAERNQIIPYLTAGGLGSCADLLRYYEQYMGKVVNDLSITAPTMPEHENAIRCAAESWFARGGNWALINGNVFV